MLCLFDASVGENIVAAVLGIARCWRNLAVRYACWPGAAIVAVAAISMLCPVGASADEPQTAAPATAPANTPKDADALRKTVLVVNARGEPIEGATVRPWAIRTTRGHGSWSLQGYGHSEPPTLTTDAEGQVTIPFPRFAQFDDRIPPQALTCRVGHSDYAETFYNDVPVTPETVADVAKIVLQIGALVEVTAFAPDEAVAIDRLHVLRSSSSSGDGPRVKINARGRLELPRLPAGTELLRLAYFPEQGPALVSEVKTPNLKNDQHVSLRAKMMPMVRVRGRLDASVPRPVKNGRVVSEINESTDKHSLDWRACAMIQEDGTFTLEDLPYGDIQVTALCDGFVADGGAAPEFAKGAAVGANEPGRPQVFPVAEADNEIVLKMVPTASCKIRVLDPDGRPVAGAQCGFWPNVHWWNGGGQIYCSPLVSTADVLRDPKGPARQSRESEQLFTATTDADGIAVVKNLPTQERSFGVHHDHFHLPIGDWNERIVRVELKAERQTEITVKVEAKEAEPGGSK
ncbi:MAG TPA: hypothetical protein VGG30_12380 [Pirellulales bacterium]|jgi:hypothetical protein